MIDYFALLLTHVLIAIMLLRLLGRDDFDREEMLSAKDEAPEPAARPATPRARRRARNREEARDA